MSEEVQDSQSEQAAPSSGDQAAPSAGGGLNFAGNREVDGMNAQLEGGINPSVMLDIVASPSYTRRKKGEEITVEKPVLDITFGSIDGERKTTFRYFDPSVDKDGKAVAPSKVQEMYDMIVTRFKNIYNAFYGKYPEDVMFANCKNIFDAFKAMEEALKPGGKPVYINEGKHVPVWLKVTFYKSNRQLPITKFIERIRPGKATLLEINPDYDQVKPEADSSTVNSIPGMPSGGPDIGDYPGFSGAADDLPM